MKFPSFQPRQLAWALVAASVVALGSFVAAAQSTADDKKTAAPKPALTVATVQPQLGRLPIKLSANGNIAAWQEASIGTEANGLRLTEVRAGIGDMVSAGQVLAVFASESVSADLALARANLMESEANAIDAASNAERARTLQATGALSTQQINQYLTADKTAQARTEASRAMLVVQQLRLKNTQVLAPDSGIISARSATVGAVLPAGTELFRMIRKGRLEWRAEVTAAELGRLRVGTTAIVTTASGAQIKGRVRMVAPTVDPQTRTALVYVDLSVTRGMAAPTLSGMFAKGEFSLGDSSSLTVPQTAVVVRDGFSYVYRVGDDNRVSRIKVQTGRLTGDQIEITSALGTDTRLVASGAGFLNDGDLVRVVKDGKPVSAASAPAPAIAASR